MSYNDYGIGTHGCGQDVAVGRRVALNASGQLVYATATSLGIGVARLDQVEGEDVGVAYFNKPGTHLMVAAGAFVVGADVFAAAFGKVRALPTAAGDYVKVGVALEAAADDGDLVEVLAVESGKVITVSS
ncbi:capsid cement protein [Pseudodesulfovibrio pelocollis]|uniref:capsid cement protein n=1 Tax=Pseudodesulfovibrio pelocollis TaxID=3051432 RepID=UPI00255A8F49|nr:capsid cement protein [Pseudodesulfovibrio sp. SB368]